MGGMVAASVGPLLVTQAPTWLRRPRRPWFPHHCCHGPAGEWVAVTHLLSCPPARVAPQLCRPQLGGRVPLHYETVGGVGVGGSVDADREESGHSPLPAGPLSHRLGTSSGCWECGMPTLRVKVLPPWWCCCPRCVSEGVCRVLEQE